MRQRFARHDYNNLMSMSIPVSTLQEEDVAPNETSTKMTKDSTHTIPRMTPIAKNGGQSKLSGDY